MLVRYYGHVGQPSGYGHAANEMCMAMLEAGIDLEIQTDGTHLHKDYLPLAPRVVATENLRPDPDVVIIHTLPVDCGTLARRQELNANGAAAARWVAYTTWEGVAPVSDDVVSAMGRFRDVWVPASSTAGAMDSVWSYSGGATLSRSSYLGSEKRLSVVPHAFGAMPAERTVPRLAGEYRFYYIGAWNVRKNPEGVIRAFARAFGPNDNVSLHIHSVGAPADGVKLALIATGLPGDLWPQWPRVTMTTDQLAPEAIEHLHQSSHCFVTASRGEAWNLPAFDAMLHRNHVIAPRGQGSDDFLSGTSAWRYTTRLTPASGEVRLHSASGGTARAQYVGCQGLSVRQDWLEPDIGELAVMMRRARMENVRELALNYDPLERFGRAAVGKIILDLLTTKETP